MANCALWVRTTRHITTHENDLDVFEDACRGLLGEDDIGGSIWGDDVVIWPIRFEGGPDTLLRLIEPALVAARFENWCAVEIGQDFACPTMVIDDDVPQPFGLALLRWGRPHLPVNTYGGKALFVDLHRERGDSDITIAKLEARLKAKVSRLWHGRSSILLAFHDPRAPDAIVEPLRPLLDDENEVASWFLFEIGARSAGRAGLDAMGDFIERNYRASKGLPAMQRPSRAPASTFRDGHRANLHDAGRLSRAARRAHAHAREGRP